MTSQRVRPVRYVRFSERGTVLLATLMVMTLLAALGAALALVVSAESVTAANYESAQQSLYAADAGIERTVGELRLLASWRNVPASLSAWSDFNDGLTIARAADGASLDLAQLTLRRQTESNAMYPTSPDRPVWHVFGHAPMNQMIAGSAVAPPYVVAWIADDPDDLDGDPATDTNDVVIIHAEAFGVRGSRRAIEATIRREEAMDAGLPGITRSDVRLIAWHEVR